MLGHVADEIIVPHAGIGADVPMGCRVDGRVEGKAAVDVPVAVDILRSRDAPARIGVIAHEVGDGVADVAVIGVEDDAALVAHDVIIIIGVQRVGELWLQTRVSLCDVERVGVVGDVKQLSHLRLAGIAAVVNPEVTLIAELIMEVECWREIGHIANGIDIEASVVLNEVRVLGLDEEADVVVVLLLVVAQRHPQIMGIVLVF